MTETNRLQPGDAAPDFTLPDADGNPVSLADYKGQRLVLYAYPAALTPGCTKQACDFTDNLEVLATAGYDVIGVIRSTFVIAPDGTIERAMYNVKATGHVAKLRRNLAV